MMLCDAYDVSYGARSIKHEVDRKIINQISELHSKMTVKVKKVHIGVLQDITGDSHQGSNRIDIQMS